MLDFDFEERYSTEIEKLINFYKDPNKRDEGLIIGVQNLMKFISMLR